MELPVTSSEVVELHKNLDKFDKTYLVTLCDFIIRQYILNSGAGYTEELDQMYRDSKSGSDGTQTFPEFIKDLQRRFNYPELQRFSVEGEKVFVNINNQKIALNGNKAQNLEAAPAPSIQEDRDFFSQRATQDDKNAGGETQETPPPSNDKGPNNGRFGSLEF